MNNATISYKGIVEMGSIQKMTPTHPDPDNEMDEAGDSYLEDGTGNSPSRQIGKRPWYIFKHFVVTFFLDRKYRGGIDNDTRR